MTDDDALHDDGRPGVSRRTVLTGTIGTAAGVAGVGLVGHRATADSGEPAEPPDEPVEPGEPGDPEPPPADEAVELRPISMAMHIHGSFSEGIGSYEAHLQQAREHGVDVIWWTDHDFRLAAHGYRSAIRFDGFTEYDDRGLDWTWQEERLGDLASAGAQFIADPRSPDEPGRAMRLTARSPGGWGILWYRGVAWNWTYSVSLADTTLELDVLAEETGIGRELLVQIHSSYHPARGGRPPGQYVLQYRIGGAAQPARRADGLTGIIELPAPRGQWERIRLRPVADFQQLWPDLIAEDNSLHQLAVGVRASDAGPTRVVIDRLRFDRGAGQGESAIELRRAVLSRYADEYPDITSYESFEVSLVRHLNWIGGDLALPDFPPAPRRNNDPLLAEEMIEFMHEHGALVQWCHPLDVAGPDQLVRLMIERNNLGADLVEIGRRPHDGLRAVLDAAARNAVFFTAVGVSDDHAGIDWPQHGDNSITYVWAASTGPDDLRAALEAGRAWWVDPARWRGSLDLRVHDGSALGGVLLTEADEVAVRVLATDLPADATLAIIESPVDLPGVADPTPATTATPVPAGELADGWADHVVGVDRFIRLMVRDGSGAVVGESNPLWILREPPPRGVPEARLIDDRTAGGDAVGGGQNEVHGAQPDE